MRLTNRSTFRAVTVPVLIFALLISACFTPAQLDRAAKASKAIAERTGEAITLVDTFYTSQTISLAVKDKLADKLIALSKGGKKFNDLIARYSAIYKDGKVPASVWSELITNFDGIWSPFGELLNLVPQAAGLKDSKAFQIVSQSVLALAKILMTNGVNVPNFRLIEERAGSYGLA